MSLAACSTQSTQSNALTSITPEDLQERNEALLTKEAELTRREAEFADAKSYSATSNTMGSLLPPGANSGECYARAWVEPIYSTSEKEVMVKPAAKHYEIVPAKYETVTERLEVKAAGKNLEVVPAVYETVTEEKLVEQGGTYWRISESATAPKASQNLLDKATSHGLNLDNATPGTCYHEHFVSAKFEDVAEQVLVKEGYDVIEAKDAEYRWVEKEVLVKEASTIIEEVPAVYETASEKVIDVPAHTVWKKGTGPMQRINEATGEIMCLVEVPATYKMVQKQVLISAATTKVTDVPAEYATVKVRELISDASEVRKEIPAEYKSVAVTTQVSEPNFVWHEVHDHSMSKASRTGNKICYVEQKDRFETVETTVVKKASETRNIDIPAEYKDVEVTKLVTEATTRETEIPAEYTTVELRELTKEGHMEWRSILCETNMTETTVSDIQRALQSRGYNPGPIDGVIGTQTMSAVNKFQKENSLPVDSFLNLKTIDALDVKI